MKIKQKQKIKIQKECLKILQHPVKCVPPPSLKCSENEYENFWVLLIAAELDFF